MAWARGKQVGWLALRVCWLKGFDVHQTLRRNSILMQIILIRVI
jgi:hypothetical protein